MFVWRGVGIAIVVLFGCMLMLVGLMFTESTSDDALHFAVSSMVTGLIWFAFMKRGAKNKVLLQEAEEQLKRPEYLDDKTRSLAERRVKAKQVLEMWDDSHLFFIPIKWWHFILGGLGIVLLCVHFFG